jgi:hypothetical protein
LSNKLVRCGFWLVVAASGLAISARALYGPIAQIRLNSPMNAAGCFGLALVLCLVARAQPGGDKPVSDAPDTTRLIWLSALALVALTAVVFWRALHFYFLSDDFIILKAVSSSSRPGLRALLTATGGDGFYRPLSTLSLALNATWARFDPAAWHASALALHIANSLLVLGLALRLCSSRLAALFAAALFAIHGTRPEAAVWISGRPDLLAAFFLLCGLLLFVHSMGQTLAKGRWFRVMSLISMILAILSKEVAYVFPVLLLAFLISMPGVSGRKFGLLAPFFVAAAGLFACRLVLLGGIGGYKEIGTGQAQALELSLMPSLKALLLRLWAALFFPINWSVQPGALLAVVMIGYLCSLIWLAMSGVDRRRLIFPFGFVLICALPPLHLLLIGADLMKSRLLYLPSVGFCLLLALAMERLRGRMRGAVPGIVVAFNLLALEHNLNVWKYVSEKSESACVFAANSIGPTTRKMIVTGLPVDLRGVHFFGNGFPEGVEMQLNRSPVPIELRQNLESPAAAEGECWLVWDQSRDELRFAAR